jgi:hypothetical protein
MKGMKFLSMLGLTSFCQRELDTMCPFRPVLNCFVLGFSLEFLFIGESAVSGAEHGCKALYVSALAANGS